jgi:hypothetical protein
MSGRKGWIGVDLDGTLARYDIWHGIYHIGEPIKPMVERVCKWLAEGQEVRIFTARVCEAEGDRNSIATVASIKRAIQQWCLTHIGMALEVTNVKDFNMIQLWDDRAVQVIPNTGLSYQYDMICVHPAMVQAVPQ